MDIVSRHHNGETEYHWPNGDTMRMRPHEDGSIEVYVSGAKSARDAIDIRPVAGNVIRISVGTVRS